MHDRSDLANRLNDAGLIIGQHDRDQRALRLAQEEPQGLAIDDTGSADRDDIDGIGGESRALQNRDMLDRRNQETVAMPARAGDFQGRVQRQHVGLGRARGKCDPGGVGRDQTGHLFAGLFDQVARAPAFGMNRGRVAEHVNCRDHGRPRLRPQGRRRVPVEIGAPRHTYLATINRPQPAKSSYQT